MSKNPAFAIAFGECTKGIRQLDLAKELAEGTCRDPKSLVPNLSRLANGAQLPRAKTIDQIAEAIGKVRNLPESKVIQIRKRLMNAAAKPKRLKSVAKLESNEWRLLRPRCQTALRKNGLSEDEINGILSQIGLSTMRIIVEADERGEEIEVAYLQNLEPLKAGKRESSQTIVPAGRAQIVIDGDMSVEQLKLVRKAAEMIEAVLQD